MMMMSSSIFVVVVGWWLLLFFFVCVVVCSNKRIIIRLPVSASVGQLTLGYPNTLFITAFATYAGLKWVAMAEVQLMNGYASK